MKFTTIIFLLSITLSAFAAPKTHTISDIKLKLSTKLGSVKAGKGSIQLVTNYGAIKELIVTAKATGFPAVKHKLTVQMMKQGKKIEFFLANPKRNILIIFFKNKFFYFLFLYVKN